MEIRIRMMLNILLKVCKHCPLNTYTSVEIDDLQDWCNNKDTFILVEIDMNACQINDRYTTSF